MKKVLAALTALVFIIGCRNAGKQPYYITVKEERPSLLLGNWVEKTTVDTFLASTPLEAYEEAGLTQLSIQIANHKALQNGSAPVSRLKEVSAVNEDGVPVQDLLEDSSRMQADMRLADAYQKMLKSAETGN
jgi:hypothetical protein